MKIYIFFLIVAASVQHSHAQLNFESIKDKVLRPLIQCPERVWPGYRPLSDGQAVLAYPSLKKAYLISKNGTITETPIDRWGAGVEADYDLSEKEGIKTALVNVELAGSDAEALETLYHEGFHYFGQSKVTATPTDRDELMPLDEKARVARVMQIRNLKAYNIDKSPESLRRASYWENWIKENRKDEWKANQYWDIVEGGAEYAGKVSIAVAELGCEASEEDIHQAVVKSVTRMGIGTRVDQSYTAGIYGYLGVKLNNLTDAFERLSDSPVTILTNNCEQEEEAEDQSIYKEFEEEFGMANREVTRAREALEKKAHLIALPWESVQGSYRPMGFYKVLTLGQKLGLMPLTHLSLSDSHGKLELTGRDLWDSQPGICGRTDSMMLVSIEDALNPSTDAEGISGSYDFVESGTLYGKKLFCPR
jgi:hypothetical protein